MTMFTAYQPRVIRFMTLHRCGDWQVKVYTISPISEEVSANTIEKIRTLLPRWLEEALRNTLPTYDVATLIIHKGKEGHFAILSWWVDENMLQVFAYLARYDSPQVFELFSHNGIFTCVWEMAVLWFERNAWVQCVLSQPHNPNVIRDYLQQHYHEII